MTRGLRLTVVLVAGTLLAGWATPAHSDQIEVRCSTRASNFFGEITGIAYYGPLINDPHVRVWTLFRYKVDGIVVGNKSNVNIRLYEAGVLKMEIKSPDDRQRGVWYEVRPDFVVLTLVGGPEGEHDHRKDDVVAFEGIFDRGRRPDPRCTAYSPPQ